MMTTAEITAFVMALPVEELRRRAAEDVMGWRRSDCVGASCGYPTHYVDWVNRPPTQLIDEWHPDIDRNQSRMVTDKVGCDHEMRGRLEAAIYRVTSTPNRAWQIATALDETRAALIAHYTHKGGIE